MSWMKGTATPRGPTTWEIRPTPSLLSPAKIAEAKAESDRIMESLPKDAGDPAIIPHLIAAAYPGAPVLFERGNAEGGTQTSHMSKYPIAQGIVQGTPLEPWHLKLDGMPSECKGGSASAVLNDASAEADFKIDVRKRIAACLGVDESKVYITGIRKGSIVVEYTVSDLTKEEKEMLLFIMGTLDEKFAEQFDTYTSSKIPLVALAVGLNLNAFDHAGTRDSWEGHTFNIGPVGHTRPYKQPEGWVRHGLKVTGVWENDAWLRPFRHEDNWYRAFHGMKDPEASTKAIYEDGFIPSGDSRLKSTRTRFGNGIYVSPHVGYAEEYCRPITVPTRKGPKQFKVAFQLAVKPGSQKEATDKEWVIEDPHNVRVYGLLLKPE